MIWALCVLLWWLSAFVPLLLMSESGWRGITWGDLFILFWLSWLGLLLGVIITLTVLSQADFWSKPIFGKRGKDDNH